MGVPRKFSHKGWGLDWWYEIHHKTSERVIFWKLCHPLGSASTWKYAFAHPSACQFRDQISSSVGVVKVRHVEVRLVLIRLEDSLVRELFVCHSAINASVLRERLKGHTLWFLSDTCKGYYSTQVPNAWRVFLVCVSKVSSRPLI